MKHTLLDYDLTKLLRKLLGSRLQNTELGPLNKETMVEPIDKLCPGSVQWWIEEIKVVWIR